MSNTNGAPGLLNNPMFNDTLQAVGLSLMSSPRSAPLGNLGKFLPAIMEKRKEEQRANATLAYLQQSHPEIAEMVAGGLNVGDAFQLSLRKQAEAAEQKRWEANRRLQVDKFEWDKAQAGKVSPTANQRDFQFAQENPAFSDFLRGSGSGEMPTSIREITERQRLAPTYNLDPNTPEGRAFVLTGKLPSSERTSTADDRRAIREADDMAREGDQTIGLLDQALKMSPEAYEGATADVRTWMGNNLYDGVVPDWVADPKTAAATKEYDNVVTTQALNSLQSTFGGAPTEGERQILLDVQGMSSQPKEVRESIIRRAKEAVQRRASFNRERANDLRGGTYYDARPAASSTGAVNLPEIVVSPDIGGMSEADLEAIANGR